MKATTQGQGHASGTVLAIIVTFHPDESRLRSLVEALLEECDAVEVVDNTPGDASGPVMASGRPEGIDPRVAITRFGENRGIGAAQNHGLARMIAGGFDFALLQDQDSMPEPGMVARLASIAASLDARGVAVGSVSPAYVDDNTGRLSSFQARLPGRWFYTLVPGDDADPWVEVATSIASGSLLTRQAVELAGQMRADFFIDQVDMEWCHRARDQGFRLFGTSCARMHHQLGEEAFRAWLFGWRKCSRYAPERLYYRFRNFTLVCRMRHVETGWKLRASAYWLFVLYANALFGERRGKNLRAMLRGIRDGALGRTGPA